MDVEKIVDKVFKEVVKQLQTEKCEQAIVIGSLKENNPCCAEYECIPFSEAAREKDTKLAIITELPNKMLANLANGYSTTEEEEYVLRYLLQGKEVIALKDGVEFFSYKNTAPKALYNTYLAYFNKLQEYGISFVTGNERISPKRSLSNQGEINKKIITEMDLQKQFLKEVSCILIPRNSIITPLAEDYIRKHRMKIQRNEEAEA
ncbi:hypothetical protein JYK21_09485 [Ralstonia pickettii]|nr:hypothetical protein [Ralstonia pickettii]